MSQYSENKARKQILYSDVGYLQLMILLYDYDKSLNLIILLTLLVHRASFEPLPGSLC